MKRIGIVVGVIALIAFIGISATRISEAKERNAVTTTLAAAPSVATIIAGKKDVPQIVSITGVVKAKGEAAIFPKLAGRVTSIKVEVGAAVKAGDVLGSLESTDFVLRAKQAEAQLQAAQAGLETAAAQASVAQAAFGRRASRC